MVLEPILVNIRFDSFVSMHKSCLWPHDRIYQDPDIGYIMYFTEHYKDIDTSIWNNGPTLFCSAVEQRMYHVAKQATWEPLDTMW